MNPDLTKAQTPEQMAISGANGTPTNQSITPSSLAQTTPIQPTIVQPTATPTVPDFLQINPQEKQLQDQYTSGQSQYADLLSQLAGREAYTTGQQAQQDVIGKQANVSNYQNQIKALQQEQQGVSLQREQNIQAKQQAMSGRGISDSIVNRHSAIDTQYNQQTLTNSIKQYSVGAQLSAAQGDLTSALNYVDQAVKLKYQPIEAQITAQNANLEAIKNNPAFTSAQQKQAEARQLQLQQYTQKIADEKKVYQDTQDAIIKTVTNNPTMTAQQSAVISNAQSPEEVAQLVNYFGLSSLSQQESLDMKVKQAQLDKANYELNNPTRQTQVIEGANGNTLLIDTNTGETIKDYGAKKAPVSSSTTSPIQTSSTGEAVVTTKDGKEIPISTEAMNWVNLINNGSISLDEALTKIGSTKASMELKNEIIAGINAQGGQTETKLAAMNNTVSSIDDILNGDFEYFGASIAPRSLFGYKVNPYYNSFKAKVDNLVASLAIDNLGLLKGPMSDKDIEFIKQMSSGLEIGMDEQSAKERLGKIKTRLQEKIKTASGTTDSQMAEQLTQSVTKEQEGLRAKYNY